MNKTNLENLSAQALAGYEDACEVHNATAKSAHDSAQASKPEDEREAYVPETVQAYADRMVESLGMRYYSQRIERRKSDPNNQAAFVGALKMMESDPEVAAAVALIKSKTGVA